MQNLAGVVVNVDVRIQLVIACREIQCFVKSFAVFPEGTAWPRESVYWIQPDYPVFPLGCTYLHRSPRRLGSSLSTLTSTRKQAESLGHAMKVGENTFSLFPSSRFPSK